MTVSGTRYEVGREHTKAWLQYERLDGNEYWGQWEKKTIHTMACQASGRVRQCLKEDDCIVDIHYSPVVKN